MITNDTGPTGMQARTVPNEKPIKAANYLPTYSRLTPALLVPVNVQSLKD
jgi:hypothetical protein